MWHWGQRLEWCTYNPKHAQDCQQPPEAGRETWARFSPRVSWRNHASWHPDFRCWPPELWQNTFLLLEVTKCVVICYSSPGKPIQLLNENLHFHKSLGDLWNAHWYLRSPVITFPMHVDIYHSCAICSKEQDHFTKLSLKLNRWKWFVSATGGGWWLHFAPLCWLHPDTSVCMDYHLTHDMLLWGK